MVAALFAGDTPADRGGKAESAKPAEASHPPALPPDLLPLGNQAKAAFERGDYAEAERIYGQILEKAPNNLYALSNLGVVLFREGKNQMAADAFQKSIALAPGDAFSHRTLGITYYQRAEWNDATIELTAAIALDPKDAVAHNYLGIVLSQKGSPAAAEKELETATKLDPDYADAHFNLAVVLATENPPKRREANEHYQRALKLGSERDSALEQLIGSVPEPAAASKPQGSSADVGGTPPAPALRAQDDTAPGKIEPTPGQKDPPPTLPPALIPLGREAREQFERGNYLEAEELYRKILEKLPDDVNTLSNLGVVLFRAGKNQMAEESFKKAISVAPGGGFSHCTLGIVYYQAGKYDDAVNELTKALVINPHDPTALNYLGITTSHYSSQKSTFIELKTTRDLKPDGYLRYQAPRGDFFTPLEMERLNGILPFR
jgi:tetratricopeptide (TPR) repeat protein